jgi:phytol kinase
MAHPLNINPWLAMGLELAVLVGLMIGLRVYQRRSSLSAESSRKLYHISGGLTTLSFPWMFASPWPVILLTCITIPTLLALKYVRSLKSNLGTVLYGVERRSFGEVYFPLSVCLLFILARGNALLFSIPILILALADTVAAVIGVRYGHLRYETADGHKSTEGSAAFFVVAFLSVLVPLLLFTNTGRAEVLGISVILGLLVMMAEAIAWRGLDNLFIPLSSFFLLKTLLALDTRGLLVQLLVTGVLSAIAYLWRSRTTLNGGAIMAAILGAYLIWTLGGWQWLFVPFVVFMSYTTLLHRTALDTKRRITPQAIFSIAVVGLLWLFVARLFTRPEFFYPFTIAFAAHVSIVGMVRHRYAVPGATRGRVLVSNIAKGWLVLGVAYLLFDGLTVAFGLHALAGLVGLTLASLAFYAIQPGLSAYPTDWPRWRREALCAALGSLAGLVPIYALTLMRAAVS